MFFRPTGGEGPEVRNWSLLIISGVSGAQCKYKDNHQPPSGEWHTPTRARVNDTITRSINLGTGSKHHAIAGCLHILFYFCSDCGSATCLSCYQAVWPATAGHSALKQLRNIWQTWLSVVNISSIQLIVSSAVFVLTLCLIYLKQDGESHQR